MEIKLAETIRTFRKERSLTQEQLAEVLGVTVGAVYKWEAGLSTPELPLIVEMADFFDTSVDVLLGYTLKDNRIDATAQRLLHCQRTKDMDGLEEAEKALKKYPNSFDIVYRSAMLYQALGLYKRDNAKLRRALELLEKARPLLHQNTNPRISEQTLYVAMAEICQDLEDDERALELFKQHNTDGLYSDCIGMIYAKDAKDAKHAQEALPYLSESLLIHEAALVRTVMGYLNLFLNSRDYAKAQELLAWALPFFTAMPRPDCTSFMDKINMIFYLFHAHALLKTGQPESARKSAEEAHRLAVRFDAAPSYAADTIRFVMPGEDSTVNDDLGETAEQAAQNALQQMDDPQTTALWQEVCNAR